MIVFGLSIWTSLRDTRFLKTPWRIGLYTLRAAVLLILLFVLLNPRERTQTTQIQKSRVGVLVDTSLSMAYPVSESDEGSSAVPDATAGTVKSRADALQETLVDSGLLDRLSETHALSVYTFDASLVGPKAVTSQGETTFVVTDSDGTSGSLSTSESPADNGVTRVELGGAKARTAEETRLAWSQLLQPVGNETRLGE